MCSNLINKNYSFPEGKTVYPGRHMQNNSYCSLLTGTNKTAANIRNCFQHKKPLCFQEFMNTSNKIIK